MGGGSISTLLIRAPLGVVKLPNSRVVLAPSAFACWQPSSIQDRGLNWLLKIEELLSHRGDP